LSVKLSKLAKEDLIDIWLYGENNWGAQSADQYLDSLDVCLNSLINFPEKFALRQEFQPPVRLAPFKSHLVVYIHTEKHIHIVRVLHQSMDMPNQI
jgi:toxin ParE1/3/4